MIKILFKKGARFINLILVILIMFKILTTGNFLTKIVYTFLHDLAINKTNSHA